MKHLDLFSGIGGFSLGLESTNQVETVAFCEKDKFCRQVLEVHWPDKPIYKDIEELDIRDVKQSYGKIDLITGGFPCQDVSIAGYRRGLKGKRSGLWFDFEQIIAEILPEWIIIENVTGLLYSNKGRDFARILWGLADIGYYVGWRVLDSQYFGVPQRRRRVFIVGHLIRRTAPTQVLFDQKSLPWNTTESRRTGKRTSRENEGSGGICGREWERNTISYNARNDLSYEEITPTLLSKSSGGWSLNYMPVIHSMVKIGSWNERETTLALAARDYKFPRNIFGARRLTPLEFERLQGFPDNWTDVCSDTQRYKQLGNAVTVNVIEWLGERLIKYA